MKVILMRHGKDKSGVRGGWSQSALIDQGVIEVEQMCHKLKYKDFAYIISSDLIRTKQTASIISRKLGKKIIYDELFREINNGDLAGMDNSLAEYKYPGLYYNTLDFEERYPNGESPKEFFERVFKAYTKLLELDENVLVVTHSGVINVLYCIHNNIPYTNKKAEIKVDPAKYIILNFE